MKQITFEGVIQKECIVTDLNDEELEEFNQKWEDKGLPIISRMIQEFMSGDNPGLRGY